MSVNARQDHGATSGVPSGTPRGVVFDPVVVVARTPVTTGYRPTSLRDECWVCGDGEALVAEHMWARASRHSDSSGRESSRDRRKTCSVKPRTHVPPCAKRFGVRCETPLWAGSLGPEGLRRDMRLSRGSTLDAATCHHSRNASGISRRLPILHASKAVLRTRTPKRFAQGGALQRGVHTEDAGILMRRFVSADGSISHSTQIFVC
jgi:hypothetical protein